MVRIACVGITVMDRIYYVEGLPTEGGKYVAKRYTEVGGGPAATSQRLWWMPKESGLSLIIPARIYYLTPTGLTTSIFRSGMWCWRMCAGMTAQNRRLRWRVRLAS